MEGWSGSALNYAAFYDKVNPGSDWDYKKQERELYFFDGHIVDGEAFGNLNYGYAGSAGRISPLALKGAAGLVQIRVGNSSPSFVGSYFDDPRDTRNIQAGINAYNASGRTNSVSSGALSSAASAVSAASKALSGGNISAAISAIKSAIKALSK